MMPILLKSVGGDKPQYRVRKSTRFCCRDAGLVLAMQTGDAAASMDDDMNQPRWLKVGRDRPQLCALESSLLFIGCRKHIELSGLVGHDQPDFADLLRPVALLQPRVNAPRGGPPCWGLVSFRLKPDQKQPYSTTNARDDRIQTAPHFQPRAEPFAFAGFGTSEC